LAATIGFSSSVELQLSGLFSLSIGLTGSRVLRPSRGFSDSLRFGNSIAFIQSQMFTVSGVLKASVGFTGSNAFTPSPPFTSSPTLRIVAVIPGGADQIASGLGSSSAIGAGLGGLAVLAGLLLLLFLKKKKKDEIAPEASIAELSTETFTDNDEFISEYGLSDEVLSASSDDCNIDLPHVVSEFGDYNSGQENVSEHNPDDLEDFSGCPDE
jgi:hypothetical protein